MDKKTGNGDSQETELQIWQQEGCRFAYTLNNEQPVRCTWISDQPLFYTDYDEVMEDDMLFDDPILEALERDIADLRQKSTAYEKISQEFALSEEDKLSLFAADAAMMCGEAPEAGTFEALLDLAHESRLASQYLSFAQINGVDIALSNQVRDASYDRESATILVREDLAREEQVLLLTRELRRMYQHKNGAGFHPLTLHPDYAVLVNRAQMADLTSHMVRVGWELYLAGHKSVWARIESSPMADLGRAFAREAIADFRSINNGLAIRATFESWFLSERCRKADRMLIQQMLAEYQGYSFADNPEASRLISLDLIKALGQVPFGQNYLDSVATQMLVDPVFTDVRDRSNANFLWFIKFERSFNEAEQEVAEMEASKPTAQILEFKARGHNDAGEQAFSGVAEIVDLYRYGQE